MRAVSFGFLRFRFNRVPIPGFDISFYALRLTKRFNSLLVAEAVAAKNKTLKII